MILRDTENRLQRFAAVRNYAVFYGTGHTRELASYDMVIVEPAGQSEQTLTQLREAGTLVLAYVSITEIPEYDPLYSLLKPQDFLSVNGKPIENADFNNRVANLNSQNWINLLLHRMGRYLRNQKYDGLFFDTISNVEWPILPAGIRAEQQAAVVALLQRLRKLYPGHIMVQNNGLESLCMDTATYLDGLCWENPDFVKPETYKWHERVRRNLHQLKTRHGHLQIMLLMEKGSTSEPAYEEAYYWAKREKYWIYLSPYQYLEIQSEMSEEQEDEDLL